MGTLMQISKEPKEVLLKDGLSAKSNFSMQQLHGCWWEQKGNMEAPLRQASSCP